MIAIGTMYFPNTLLEITRKFIFFKTNAREMQLFFRFALQKRL